MALSALAVGGGSNAYAQQPDTLIVNDNFIATDGLQYALQRTGGHFETFERDSTQWRQKREWPTGFPADSTGWLYLRIKNIGSADRSLKLHFHNVLLTRARLYSVWDQQVDSSLATGYELPVSRRATGDRDMAIPLMIPKGKTTEVYVSVMRRAIPNVLLLDVTDPAKDDSGRWEDLVIAMVIGFCLLMWLTAMALALYRKNRDNLFYLMYCTGGTMYLASVYGLGSIYLWPEAPWFQETAPVFWVSFGIIGFTLFSRSVLRIREMNRNLDIFLQLFIVSGVILMLSGWAMSAGWIPSKIYPRVAMVTGIYTAVAMTLILGVSLRRTFHDQQKEFGWFSVIFGNLYILCLGALILETGWLSSEHVLTVMATALAVPLEMFLTQLFIVTRVIRMTKEGQQEEIRMMQEREYEQFRISRDIHDDIGSGVNSIKVWAELLKNRLTTGEGSKEMELISKIVRNTTVAIDHIRTLVEATNPKNKLGEKLIAYLRDLAFERLSDLGIGIHFEVEEQVNEVEIPPLARRHLILAFKEALNNIIRHAHATSVIISIWQKKNWLWMSIKDNGCGFEPGQLVRMNGLDNMKQGSLEINGAFHLSSSPGNGAEIRVGIPL